MPGSNALPSRFQIGAKVWIHHGAARRRGVVVGVSFRVLQVDYLVQTVAGVECVDSLDIGPVALPHAVQGNVVALAARSEPCT